MEYTEFEIYEVSEDKKESTHIGGSLTKIDAVNHVEYLKKYPDILEHDYMNPELKTGYIKIVEIIKTERDVALIPIKECAK